MDGAAEGIADFLDFKSEDVKDYGSYRLNKELLPRVRPLYVIIYAQSQYNRTADQQPQELANVRKEEMGNPILVKLLLF